MVALITVAIVLGLLGFFPLCMAFQRAFWGRVDGVRPMTARVDATAVLTDSRPRATVTPGVGPAERAAIEEEVTGLGEELARHPFVPGPAASQDATSWYRKALDSYEAAGRSLLRLNLEPDRPWRDLADGRYALAALDAVLQGKPSPAREPCFFDHNHPAASTKILWAPYGGEPRWIPACDSCAERRGPRVPTATVGKVIEGAAAGSVGGARLITTFRGRGDHIIELPHDEAGLLVLRIRMSLLNSYAGGITKTDAGGAEIHAIRAGEDSFFRGGDLLAGKVGSVRGRVVVPAKTTLEIKAVGRWSIEVWSTDAAHGFAYRASGGKGMDVFAYRGTRPGTAAVRCDAEGFSVDVWRKDDSTRTSSTGNAKLHLRPGDLLAVSAERGAWSIDVADSDDSIGKALP